MSQLLFKAHVPVLVTVWLCQEHQVTSACSWPSSASVHLVTSSRLAQATTPGAALCFSSAQVTATGAPLRFSFPSLLLFLFAFTLNSWSYSCSHFKCPPCLCLLLLHTSHHIHVPSSPCPKLLLRRSLALEENCLVRKYVPVA